jgi:lipopolysaccharide exporter
VENKFRSIINFFYKKTTKSEFVKNSFMLTFGTTLAQLIPILISPVLTRLFTPEDYGILALFTTCASLIGVVATARYEMAIVLPEKESDAINIVFLSGIITLFVTIVSIFIVTFGNHVLTFFLKNSDISPWLYLVPVSVFLIGFYQIFNYWTVRTKQFRHLTFSKISQTVTGSGTNLALGFAKFGTFGLVIGGIAGQLASTFILFLQSLKSLKQNLGFVSKEKIIEQAKIYSDFPKINSLHAFLDIFRDSLIIFLLSSLFNNQVLGFYSFTLRILKSPASLVGSSVAQVFFQKASELKNTGGNLQPLVKKMILKLSIVSAVPFLILMIFSPVIFSFVFGAKWHEAGIYASILSPWLFLVFISSPISQIPIIVGRQKTSFILSLIGGCLLICSILIGALVFKSIIVGLIILSLSESFFLLYIIVWIYKISFRKADKNV